MRTNKTNGLVQGAAIAAAYVVLTMLFQPISFGPIQARAAEALCALVYFTPAAVPGVFLGCLISNFLGGAVIADVIFGSLATLIGMAGANLFRQNRYMVSLCPILSNTLIIPWILRFAYGSQDLVGFLMITIAIGEILTAGLLAQFLITTFQRYQYVIFPKLSTQ